MNSSASTGIVLLKGDAADPSSVAAPEDALGTCHHKRRRAQSSASAGRSARNTAFCTPCANLSVKSGSDAETSMPGAKLNPTASVSVGCASSMVNPPASSGGFTRTHVPTGTSSGRMLMSSPLALSLKSDASGCRIGTSSRSTAVTPSIVTWLVGMRPRSATDWALSDPESLPIRKVREDSSSARLTSVVGMRRSNRAETTSAIASTRATTGQVRRGCGGRVCSYAASSCVNRCNSSALAPLASGSPDTARLTRSRIAERNTSPGSAAESGAFLRNHMHEPERFGVEFAVAVALGAEAQPVGAWLGKHRQGDLHRAPRRVMTLAEAAVGFDLFELHFCFLGLLGSHLIGCAQTVETHLELTQRCTRHDNEPVALRLGDESALTD